MLTRPRRQHLLLLATGAAVLLAPPAVAHADGFRTLVPSAAARLPRGSREVGRLPASTPLRLTVALEPRDPAALAGYAAAVGAPPGPRTTTVISASPVSLTALPPR